MASVELIATTREKKAWSRPPISMAFQARQMLPPSRRYRGFRVRFMSLDEGAHLGLNGFQAFWGQGVFLLPMGVTVILPKSVDGIGKRIGPSACGCGEPGKFARNVRACAAMLSAK